MNYQDYIHLYIDGDISPESEQILFTEMAHNSSLRNEMQQYIRLHTLAHSDMAATPVPEDVSASVFATLGIPQSVIIPEKTMGIIQTTETGVNNNFRHILTATIFSIITICVIISLLPQSSHDRNQSVTNESNQEISHQSIMRSDVSTTLKDTSQSYYGDNARPTIERSHRVSKKGSTRQKVSPISLSSNVVTNSVEDIITHDTQDIYHAHTKELHTNTQYKLPMPPSIQQINFHNDKMLGKKNLGENFSIVMRSVPLSQQIPSITLPVQSSPDVHNIAVGLYYSLSENHTIGIEGGREEFTQQFTRTLSNQVVEYRQKPSLYWYGVQYRLSGGSSFSIDDVIMPYIQTFGGWAQNGPLIRVGAGISLFPQQKISLFTGVEVSRLFYPVQAVYFSSDKISLTAGVSLNF